MEMNTYPSNPHTTIESSIDGFNIDFVLLHDAQVIKYRILNGLASSWERFVFSGFV